MKNKTLVITRPDHDITTSYLCYWCKEILEQAEKTNTKVVDLKSKRANKKEFESVMKKVKPSLILLNGHGSDDSITGIDNEILLKAGENVNLLENAISYAVSCSSAKKLGQESVKQGAKAYIGYTDEFVFLLDETKITRPLEDKTAQLFLEPSNQVAVSLLKNHTAKEAYERSKKHFRKNIQRLLTSESKQEDTEALPYLLWDMNHQVCLGDEEATA